QQGNIAQRHVAGSVIQQVLGDRCRVIGVQDIAEGGPPDRFFRAQETDMSFRYDAYANLSTGRLYFAELHRLVLLACLSRSERMLVRSLPLYDPRRFTAVRAPPHPCLAATPRAPSSSGRQSRPAS